MLKFLKEVRSLIAVALLVLTSCITLDEGLDKLEYPIFSLGAFVTTDEMPLDSVFTIAPAEFLYTGDSFLIKNNLTFKEVKQFKTDKLTLQSEEKLSYIRSVDAYLTTTNPAGSDTIRIAYNNSISATAGNTLELIPTDNSIYDLVTTAGDYKITLLLKVNFRTVPPLDKDAEEPQTYSVIYTTLEQQVIGNL